ncbi:peroxidase family protein [Mesorhizobium huakuii]|uniref:Peroxidase family protein n=1 Tax=Mesorhizobium huakuii TaxID=28104 RepID=A0ABZ0VZ50_9HYPH|nr:peroxidase family protein [Mesorhizobium huakuii]WQC02571.1 peroxidase family protein [Mesorhizobium huakuii]
MAAFIIWKTRFTSMLHGETSSFEAANVPNRSNHSSDDGLNDKPTLQGIRLFPSLTDMPIALFAATEDESAIDRTKAALLDITTEMVGPSDGLEDGDLSPTPAGFTYFGQFVFHDIVFSQIFGLPQPTGKTHHLKNASSQGLDLSGLYGRGPIVDAHLYDVPDGADLTACRFPIGLPCMKDSMLPVDRKTVSGRDLPRIDMSGKFISVEGRRSPYRPLVADPRNDDNLVLSQLLCTLMCIHNRIVDLLLGGGTSDPAEAYRRARVYLTSVYRTVIINDYLRKVLASDIWDHFFASDDFQGTGVSALETFNALPLEFTFGASRFAHAMVRQFYVVNDSSAEDPANLRRMLSFSSLRAGGEIPIPENWIVDWSRFASAHTPLKAQSARRIGPFLSKELTIAGLSSELNGTIRPVAFMDCWRCYDLGLPSGQDVAGAVKSALGDKGIDVPVLTGNDMLPTAACAKRYVYNAGRLRAALQRYPEFLSRTPLSYYIIQEASVLGNDGGHLGPVGSYIVAATIASALFKAADTNLSSGRLIPDVEPKTLAGLLDLNDTAKVPDAVLGGLVHSQGFR